MDKIINEIDRRVIALAEKEKKSKTKILKAQYSASQTTLVLLKMWINNEDIIYLSASEIHNKLNGMIYTESQLNEMDNTGKREAIGWAVCVNYIQNWLNSKDKK